MTVRTIPREVRRVRGVAAAADDGMVHGFAALAGVHAARQS